MDSFMGASIVVDLLSAFAGIYVMCASHERVKVFVLVNI